MGNVEKIIGRGHVPITKENIGTLVREGIGDIVSVAQEVASHKEDPCVVCAVPIHVGYRDAKHHGFNEKNDAARTNYCITCPNSKYQT